MLSYKISILSECLQNGMFKKFSVPVPLKLKNRKHVAKGKNIEEV